MPPEHRQRLLALGAAAAVMLSGCSTAFDGCRASRTCKVPSNESSAGFGGSSTAGSASGGAGGLTTPASGGVNNGIGGGGGLGGRDQSGAGEAGQGGEGPIGQAGHASADGGEAGGGAGGEPASPDSTPPTIVNILPEDGAHAVHADTDIVVTFSEAMDEVETEAAFQCDACLPTRTTFAWSANGKVMTVHTPGSFEYALPDASPLGYSFSVTSFARDLAGNHLTKDETVSFDTGHTHSITLKFPEGRLVHHSVPGPDKVDTPCGAGPVSIANSDALLLVFSFGSTSQLTGILDFISAKLHLSIAAATAMTAASVNVVPDDLSWDVPILDDLGAFSPDPLANDVPFVDVTNSVRDDFANSATRSNSTEYLIRFADTAASQTANLPCGGADTLNTVAATVDAEYLSE